ncbi:MAG TPA: hypothetical protein VNC41_18655 [Acidimicrobiia bacterium]|nr:hypothetical protein [Acidimicrobiia bacterium]
MSKHANGRAPVDREARRNIIILMVITTTVMVAIVGGTILVLGN